MATTKLDKAAWQKTLDQLSKSQLVGKEVEIEVTGLSIGDQIEQEWIQLLGISYDPKNDLIEILVEGLDHLIRKPREVWIDHGPTGLASMEVIDADDVRPWLLDASSDEGAATTDALPIGLSLQEMERRMIEATLQRFSGHRAKTAQALGIGLRTLTTKLKEYGRTQQAA